MRPKTRAESGLSARPMSTWSGDTRPPLTPLRQRVLDLVTEAGAPVKAYDLLAVLRQERGRAAPPLVYRALARLQRLGLVLRLESRNAYVRSRVSEPGLVVAFLICAECAGAREVEDPVTANALSMLATSLGFTTRAHVIELLGTTCRRCRKDAP